MPGAALPKVSALMGAYNYGPYIAEAIVSAMEQDYPPDRLELVIVDDGSTDDTAEIVTTYVDRYPGRIKFIQQANAGASAATNRARTEASGDLIALLDADDVWLHDKTRKQVELMLAQPDLGLVFSRMRLIDAHGATIHQQYGHQGPIGDNQFARILWENVAVQSSLIIDAELFDQIPPQAPYADWWLALRAAQFKRVEYLTEDLVLYRWHGANITGGVTGIKSLREAQKGISFQRWVLRSFELSELGARLDPTEMSFVWGGLEHEAAKGLAGIKSHFGVLTPVDDDDREQARVHAGAAERAAHDGDLHGACLLLLRARACDPYDYDLHIAFDQMVTRAVEAAKLPDPIEGNRGFAVLADASFLLADDRHLRDYADAMHSVSAATLVIDASRMDPDAAAAQLGELVQRCGLADDEETTMIGIIGELHPSQRFRVRRATKALYAAPSPGPREPNVAPVFTPDSLPQLRELAELWEREQQSP